MGYSKGPRERPWLYNRVQLVNTPLRVLAVRHQEESLLNMQPGCTVQGKPPQKGASKDGVPDSPIFRVDTNPL